MQHDVVVQLPAQPAPQFHGFAVERDAGGTDIIIPYRHGIPCRVAPAQPALFQDRDIADTMVPGQVIGRAQAMAAASDYDDIISRFGSGLRQAFCQFW